MGGRRKVFISERKRMERPKPVKNEIKVRKVNENKFEDARYRTSPRYTFLQYIKVAYKWAMTNYDISRRNLELLFYLYGIGTFTKKEFVFYSRLLMPNGMALFNSLMKHGWIVMWRDYSKLNPALFVLSDKAKKLCDKVHKICLGEIEISENPRVNFIAEKNENTPRINMYYMYVIRDMNKKFREKKQK
jgi:hypothetical protein